MNTTTTLLKGLAFDIEVVEVHQTDSAGCILFYRASVIIRPRHKVAGRLIRRSRIPGAATELARHLHKRGIRALDELAARQLCSTAP